MYCVGDGVCASKECDASDTSKLFCIEDFSITKADASNTSYFYPDGKLAGAQSLSGREQGTVLPVSFDRCTENIHTDTGHSLHSEFSSLVPRASNDVDENESYFMMQALPSIKTHVPPPPQLRSEQRQVTRTWQPPASSVAAEPSWQSQLTSSPAANNFDLNSGFQTMELVSPAAVSDAAKKVHRNFMNDSHNRATPKPLFSIPHFNKSRTTTVQNNVTVADSQSICASSEDMVEDRSSTALVTGNLDTHMETVTPPYCQFSPSVPSPVTISSGKQLHSHSSRDTDFSIRQTLPGIRTMCRPYLRPVFQSSSPPPPPPVTSSEQSQDSKAFQQPRIPSASWLYFQPPLPPPPPPPPPPTLMPQQLPVSANSGKPCFTWTTQQSHLQPPLPLLPPPPPPPPSTTCESKPAVGTLWQSHETPSALTSITTEPSSQFHLSEQSQWFPSCADHSSNFTSRFQAMEFVSPAAVSSTAKKMPQHWSENNCYKATAKQLLDIPLPSGTPESGSTMDEDDNVPDSWEDMEDSDFPEIKSSSAVMATNSDCCDDSSTGNDWFTVKPGQLESAKWSLTFRNKAFTPPLQCTKSYASMAAYSAPAISQSKNSGRKMKRPYNLYRPDTDDGDTEEMVDWSMQFKTRYELVKSQFIDSHCHLDFLFRRSNFNGSFDKYRRKFQNTFPSSFAGCVTVFCNPKTWTYESEGKICIFLF